MKDIYILGSLGSIGTQTLEVIRENKDLFNLIAISVGSNIELANSVIEEFKPKLVCVRKKEDIDKIKAKDIKIVYGDEGLLEVAKFKSDNQSILVNALVGSVGLKPTIEAINSNKDIALANKETLVMAGNIINRLIEEKNVNLYPIDSEHSAIWQCLIGEDIKDVKRIILTASGGSFRDKTLEELKNVTKKEALNHPNWNMGPKITIDSATMMNKGFEVIEAHFLFNIPYEKIDTIMHKESIIHSMVEYNDLSIKAVLGNHDMKIPIMYALTYPKHNIYKSNPLDLLKTSSLTFNELSKERYKCLDYAYKAGIKGGVYPCVLNAANEAAVMLFLDDKIKFLEIEEIIEKYLDKEYTEDYLNIDDIISLDKRIQKEILESK